MKKQTLIQVIRWVVLVGLTVASWLIWDVNAGIFTGIALNAMYVIGYWEASNR